MACPILCHHHTVPPPLGLQVLVGLRPRRLEMLLILIIQVSRHVGHANLIVTCWVLIFPPAAEIYSVLYRPNDTSSLRIVDRMQQSK